MKFTPEVNYAMMRVALEMFETVQEQLDESQRMEVMQRVNREMAIGKQLLESSMANRVVIPDSVVQKSFDELRGRFDSEDDFLHALAQNDLDKDSLKQAITYELKVEAVLEQLLNEQGSVSDEEVEIYYYQHLEKFSLPETRTARHILITINEEYAENSRERVQKRMEEILEALQRNPESFSEMATRHSECPTAMHEGLLGRIKPGQLYPELDAELFAMEQGAIHGLIETEVGLHILQCDTVHEAGRIPFEDVRDRLREHLEQKKRKRLLQEWLHKAA